MLKNIYILLKQRLETITELDEVDYFLGQFIPNEEGFIEMKVKRGAYIEFEPIEMSSLGGRVQEGVVNFLVHLVDVSLHDSGVRITDTTLDHMAHVESVYKTLLGHVGYLSSIPGNEGLQGTSDDVVIFNGIDRIGIIPDHSLGRILVTSQRFCMMAHDISALTQYNTKQTNLSIEKSVG